MDRLTETSGLPDTVRLPAYQPENYEAGIVHLGLGAFHRGHMAVYTDDVLAANGGNWRIVGVSLRSPGVRDNMAPQNCLYTLVERDTGGENLRLIGSIKEVLVAPENPEQVLKRLCDPGVQIFSFTITEKGYLRDPATGALLSDHPDIVHDLQNPDNPKTMPGYVVEALARRRKAGLSPVTLLCCDNLPENGESLKASVCGFARLRDAELADWIETQVAFPCTMVDRIVPATTQDDIDATSRRLGRLDQAPVICESFSQWVIEDSFSSARPAWESFGAAMVKDVRPYEDMKLRLLNCSHSAMAYLGYLGSIETIDRVIETPEYQKFVQRLMKEVMPTLDMPPGVDLEKYCADLIERFRNPNLKHRTWQIAMDGSQKIPQRILNTIRDLIAQDRPYPCLALAVAGWMRYVTGVDEQGAPIDVSDPLADQLRKIADANTDAPEAYATEVMKIQEIFGSDLPDDQGFTSTIIEALKTVYTKGAKQAVSELT